MQDEVDKLLVAGFIREVEYPDWLANVVVVPKKGGKWQVCFDYTILNDACLKDNFLPTANRPNSGLHRRTQNALFSRWLF
ncbi:hypothetical protein CK203_083660 [Vitis vinifera]|uniref:Transposon Ty3-I Gag-Pol polyprotein n=1 Tax=Vitis vinifera TaxID=29760 RepID=A0A438CYE0_VITVI|nr:hypothetical protein CK203_083660 [Vitis vinifera]